MRCTPSDSVGLLTLILRGSRHDEVWWLEACGAKQMGQSRVPEGSTRLQQICQDAAAPPAEACAEARGVKVKGK